MDAASDDDDDQCSGKRAGRYGPKLKKSFAKVKALLYFQKTYCTLVTLEIP
jgi:hypothetical protein